MNLPIPVSTPPQGWSGRVDGTTSKHLRWHQAVTPFDPAAEPGATVLLGFACDEGVARNKGRRGAATGPDALRSALASMALPHPIRAHDAGTIAVAGDRLEAGQDTLAAAVTTVLDAGHFPVVLGGGHEMAYGTYLGLARSSLRTPDRRVGILNVDAHFDLRPDPVASSGTPFRQILEHEGAAGTAVQYSVIGIAQPSNTAALFDTARRLGVRYLSDDDSFDRTAVHTFVAGFLAEVDLVYLTIDLDVLPAAVAPGVSAPAAFGVPVETVQFICDTVSASGKLAVCDVAELNPVYDIDQRTARTAARLIHRLVVGQSK
ncbi:formimidoylglutamase [Rhodococcus tibetensis]|uniref:Formimidoylglutamase n=1 Tax=Rhodococcus tibetensis TaxID=2965064 RepID=A0ABT1Q9F0_9NOCA|nr:formimidoylglutamase [Rhodococcus sp. FXJ9.536]MCQ4117732.1 formimidoylglutamase [Rhodococcus sp. FXJ9.536]